MENQQMNGQTNQQIKEHSQTIQPPQKFFMGKYLGSIPNGGVVSKFAYGSVDGNSFKFTSGIRGIEFVRIPRAKINEIIIDDKSLLAQRLHGIDKSALENIVSLGIKPKKYYCLVINWDDKDGIKHHSFFEFTGFLKKSIAADAAAALKGWMSRQMQMQ